MAGVAGALAPRAYLLAMLVAAPAIRLLISEFQFAAIGSIVRGGIQNPEFRNS